MARRESLRVKLIAGIAALVVTAGALLVYQMANRGASFRRGGEFATGEPARDGPTRGSVPSDASPGPGDTGAPALPGDGTAAPPPPGSPGTTDPPTSGTTAGHPVASPASTTTSGPPAPPTAGAAAQPEASPPGPAPTPGPVQPEPAGPRLPALGTYTYAVDGEEEVTLIGTRRFPERMTTVAHGAPGLAPDQVVLDLTYSDQHEEREIVGYRADGVYFDFEGGSVTFGPRSETSQADYHPPMLQIPQPLEAGVTRTGTSEAKREDGSVVRTEDWKVTVLGKETVSAAGGTVEAWKVQVDRRSRPGSSESVVRQRVYWYDPARSIWVRFTENVHGERKTGGFTFTYDAHLTATLMSFSPSS